MRLGLAALALSSVAAKSPNSQVKSYNQAALHEVPIIRSGASQTLNDSGTAFKAPSPSAEDQAIFIKSRSIIYTAGGRWPNPANIDHCWVNPEATSADMIQDLQYWVSAEYKKAGIGFQWNGKCTSLTKANQIRTYVKREFAWTGDNVSAGSGLSWIGPVNAKLGGSDGDGTMRIDVGKDVLGYPSGQLKDWLRETTRAMVVHEFGHALGLAHEQERSDSPICQDQRGTLPNGGSYLFVGQYDPNSIMNYCKSGPNAASLSEGDITGLKTLYQIPGTLPVNQPKNSYTIRSRSTNGCLALKNSKQNTLIDQVPCDQSLEQAFLSEASGAYVILKSALSNLCLDIPGGEKIEGLQVQQFPCNGTAAQKWKLETRGGGWVAIRNQASNKCLSVEPRKGLVAQVTCGYEAHKAFGFFPVKGNMPVSTRLSL